MIQCIISLIGSVRLEYQL